MVNRSSLDDFTDRVCSKDANVRLEVYQQIEEYFKTTRKPIVCHDLKRFADSTLAWVTSSNFKVAIDGIMLTQLVMSRLTEDMKLYSAESLYFFPSNFYFCTYFSLITIFYLSVIAVMADRLGDSKEQVNILINLISLHYIFFTFCFIQGSNYVEKLANFYDGMLRTKRKYPLFL